MSNKRSKVVLLDEEFIVDKYNKARDDMEYGSCLIEEYLNKKDNLYIIKKYGSLFSYQR